MKLSNTYSVLILCLLLFLSQNSCKKEKEDPPTPVVPIEAVCTITQPADSTEVQIGSIVSVLVELSGFSDSVKVIFSVDNVEISEDSHPPFKFSWDTQSDTLGTHIIGVVAKTLKTTASDNISIILIDTIPPLMPPVPVISITPETGNTDTIFCFDASGSYDFEDPQDALFYRWDFDGDGNWDTEFTQELIHMYKYAHPNVYEVKLEVRDTDSLFADTTQIRSVLPSGNPDACEGYVSIPYGGKVYHTIAIGDQCWLKENIDIGLMVPDSKYQSDNDTIEKYCYNNDSLNCVKYGGLYTWKEMMKHIPFLGASGICPNGWHVPSDDELKELEGYTDSQFEIGDPAWDAVEYRGFDAGKHLKALTDWVSGGIGDNLYDFKALPGGYWETGMSFRSVGEEAHFWSADHDIGQNGIIRTLKFNTDQVSRSFEPDETARSIRCLRN